MILILAIILFIIFLIYSIRPRKSEEYTLEGLKLSWLNKVGIEGVVTKWIVILKDSSGSIIHTYENSDAGNLKDFTNVNMNILDKKEYKHIDTDMFHLIGQDRSPSDLMYFLDNGDINTVRSALLRLVQFETIPEHLEKIKKWSLIAPTCFLNKEIIRLAHEILSKHSCL